MNLSQNRSVENCLKHPEKRAIRLARGLKHAVEQEKLAKLKKFPGNSPLLGRFAAQDLVSSHTEVPANARRPEPKSVGKRSPGGHTLAMNRSELVAAVAEKTGNSQVAVNGVLDAVFEVFVAQISQGEKVSIPGWLAVERTDRAARTGRNPQTGEAIQIPAGHSVKLTAGSKLKAAVTGK